MAGKIYSKDPKLKKEIESARKYNADWDDKRFDLLRQNMNEMLLEYPLSSIPILNSARKALGVNYLKAQNYKTNRFVGYLLATVYGDPESLMADNPDFETSDLTFNGLTFGSPTSTYIYLKLGRSGSAAHELWHAGTRRTTKSKVGSYKTNPHHFAVVKYLKQDPYIKHLLTTKQLNWDASVTNSAKNYNYVWNPDEVLARRAALMHYLNWDPTKKATLKDVQEWRKKGLLDLQKPLKNNPTFYNTPNVNLSRLSDQTILHLINDVALNNTPSQDTYLINDVYYAYKGGLIKKPKK